jgi:hypothetical protein
VKNKDDLDEIYADTWDRRAEKLGDRTYQEFLASDHWAHYRKLASGRLNYQKCEFCSCTEVELHHTSYKWIWSKDELRGVISLCRRHHQEVHDLAKTQGISVRLATNKLRRHYKPDYTQKNRLPG